MTNLTKWSFKNKAAIIVMVVLTLGLGIASYFRLPMEFLPKADNPQVTVSTLGQGYNAQSMNQLVTEPIENAVAGVKGKTTVLSKSGDGYSQVNIFFDSDTDMKDAKRQVSEAIQSINLPDNISQPFVLQLDTSMIPIAQVGVTFSDEISKQEMKEVEEEILPQFQSIDGVASVMQFGKANPLISVQLDKEQLAKYHLPMSAVMGVLQGQNLSVAVGDQAIDGKMSNIKVMGNLDSIDDLKQLPITNPATGQTIATLEDIATIKQETGEEGITRLNGKEVLALTFTKSSDASAVTVGENIQKVVDDLNKSNDEFQVDTAFSTAEMVEHSINGMLREVLLGALFATLVIVLFLRNIRSTLITIVSIPLSLALTLFLLWQSGITLNILTLGGVAVAVGRLVDDSIVVVENIFRRKQEGVFGRKMIIKAVGEVGKAITASTLTTIAVFLPMGLISGSLKAFILPFALTVTYSLLASLIVALTVVPLMSAWLLGKSKLREHKTSKRYMKVLTWNLNHKFVPITVAVVVLIGSVAMYFMLPKGAISAKDASMVNVTLTYPSDTPTDKVQENTKSFEKELLDIEGYKFVVTQLGNSETAAKWGGVTNPTQAIYTVIMAEDGNGETYIEGVEALASKYPDAEIDTSSGSFMGVSSSTINLDLVGDNQEDLEKAASDIMASIKGLDGVNKISSNLDAKKPVYSVVVDTTKANTQNVAMQLRALLGPTPIGSVNIEGKSMNVFMSTDVDLTSEEDLKNLSVTTRQGVVPVSSVASIELNEQIASELHKNGDPYVRVSVAVEPQKLSVVTQELYKKVDAVDLPEGVTMEKGGAAAQQADDFIDLGLTALASIGLVYLIMVITFKSIRTPLAILMTLPLASIGAILGLIISQVSIDPTALLGGLMLIGIVVTNAIVLVDRIKQNEEKESIREAIVEAAATRTRPILMTAIATISAMLPLLFSTPEAGSLVSKGLAAVVIGGLAVATVLTLFIVPVFYELFYFRKSKKQRQSVELNKEEIA